jgi:hypothetical protein
VRKVRVTSVEGVVPAVLIAFTTTGKDVPGEYPENVAEFAPTDIGVTNVPFTKYE